MAINKMVDNKKSIKHADLLQAIAEDMLTADAVKTKLVPTIASTCAAVGGVALKDTAPTSTAAISARSLFSVDKTGANMR